LVSSRFLLQTLDKKLMSDLKVRKFQKNRQKQLVSSEWSMTLGSTEMSSDSVITDGDNLNLITSGACGSFIHGLEDEFLEVRAEAVDSLCSLAVKCPQFAAKSIDFLVDMFNDEIEAVRLKAILALNKILHYVLLGDDQVEIVVSVIEVCSLTILFKIEFKTEITPLNSFLRTVRSMFENL
jgi:integrator complex subunit 4